jgi:hypothetical protein
VKGPDDRHHLLFHKPTLPHCSLRIGSASLSTNQWSENPRAGQEDQNESQTSEIGLTAIKLTYLLTPDLSQEGGCRFRLGERCKNTAGLAEAHARCKNVNDGLATVEEAFAMTRPDGEQFCLPEIHRIKGELLLARSANDRDAAEAAFGEALSVARTLQAKVMELRAAMSMAHRNGKTISPPDQTAIVARWINFRMVVMQLARQVANLTRPARPRHQDTARSRAPTSAGPPAADR